MNIERNS